MASEAVTPPDGRLPAAGGTALISASVVIKGEIAGGEDLAVEGRVEGRIDLPVNALTIGRRGRVRAHVVARTVVILGEFVGTITAADSVDVRPGASVDGDIVAPRVSIAQGSRFQGSIDMQERVQPPARASDRQGGVALESPGPWRPPTVRGY
jgi:cytoskeletal protein CcmA (bactofilin family)